MHTVDRLHLVGQENNARLAHLRKKVKNPLIICFVNFSPYKFLLTFPLENFGRRKNLKAKTRHLKQLQAQTTQDPSNRQRSSSKSAATKTQTGTETTPKNAHSSQKQTKQKTQAPGTSTTS
jgi:hypothetical protein